MYSVYIYIYIYMITICLPLSISLSLSLSVSLDRHVRSKTGQFENGDEVPRASTTIATASCFVSHVVDLPCWLRLGWLIESLSLSLSLYNMYIYIYV